MDDFNYNSSILAKDNPLGSLALFNNDLNIYGYILLPDEVDGYFITWSLIDSNSTRLINDQDYKRIIYDMFEYDTGYKIITLRASINRFGKTITRDWKCIINPLEKGINIIKIDRVPTYFGDDAIFMIQGTVTNIDSTNHTCIIHDDTGMLEIRGIYSYFSVGDYTSVIIERDVTSTGTRYYLKRKFCIPAGS